MIYWWLIHILTFFLDFFNIMGAMNRDKDLEIIILRQQMRILQRKVKTPPGITDLERTIMCFLQKELKSLTLRTELPEQMLLQNGGYARFVKSVSTISWF